MTATIRLSLLLILTLPITPAQAGERDPALAGFFAAPLAVETVTGDRHEFTVYLAITPQQRAHGLMFVRSLPADYGMLFLYHEPQVISMWMKNTVLSLDMLFIRPDGTIANIAHDTTPRSLASIRSSGAVTGVLELNAGTAKRLELAPGDRIVYRAFAKTPSGAESPASDRH
ncbi:MAG: DUF192 domain-containing protein [Gammaproteobacteria bacterium]|nr:DUF192 domain-containing protein [Gammaproteobacteria bacterium]